MCSSACRSSADIRLNTAASLLDSELQRIENANKRGEYETVAEYEAAKTEVMKKQARVRYDLALQELEIGRQLALLRARELGYTEEELLALNKTYNDARVALNQGYNATVETINTDANARVLSEQERANKETLRQAEEHIKALADVHKRAAGARLNAQQQELQNDLDELEGMRDSMGIEAYEARKTEILLEQIELRRQARLAELREERANALAEAERLGVSGQELAAIQSGYDAQIAEAIRAGDIAGAAAIRDSQARVAAARDGDKDSPRQTTDRSFDLPPALQLAVNTPLIEASKTMALASQRQLEAAEMLIAYLSGGAATATGPISTQGPQVSTQASESERFTSTFVAPDFEAGLNALTQSMSFTAERIEAHALTIPVLTAPELPSAMRMQDAMARPARPEIAPARDTDRFDQVVTRLEKTIQKHDAEFELLRRDGILIRNEVEVMPVRQTKESLTKAFRR